MIILTYHGIRNKGSFKKQIEYLVSSKYNFLSLNDFLTSYSNQSFGQRDILITFDDGDRTIFENAMPILKKHGCPSVAFVITELIGTNHPYWWEEIMFYTNDKSKLKEAKRMSNSDRLEYIKKIRSLGKGSLKCSQLTIEELKIMEKNGMDIANHSCTHPMMDKLQLPEILNELRSSRQFLQEHGFPYGDVFAYPNGNYSEATEITMAREKMRIAFLFDHRLNKRFDNPYRISRLSVNDTTPLWKYKFILSGWHSKILPLIKAIKTVGH